MHERGAAGDGLPVVGFIKEAHVEVPPVVEQRNEVGHDAARGEFARDITVLSPLVLEFIIEVLRIGALAGEMEIEGIERLSVRAQLVLGLGVDGVACSFIAKKRLRGRGATSNCYFRML